MKKSRSELHDALIHVRYTIDQLISMIYWNKLQGKLPLDVTQKAIFANACLESSLVSLRILLSSLGPCRDFLQHLVRDFLSTSDSEHAPISQELEAIELYLVRIRPV
jgi:hypothetical protein